MSIRTLAVTLLSGIFCLRIHFVLSNAFMSWQGHSANRDAGC